MERDDILGLKDTVEAFESIIKDARRLSSGNVSHQRVHIIGTAEWWLNRVKEQTSELAPDDVLAEGRGAVSYDEKTDKVTISREYYNRLVSSYSRNNNKN